MPIAGVEATVQRYLTRAFVLADSTSVVLARRTETPDGAGGSVYAYVPLPSQTMRLIPLGETGVERQGIDGRLVRPTYALLGQYGADMERFDQFTHDGLRYEVVFVHENRQYEVKGEVSYVGE